MPRRRTWLLVSALWLLTPPAAAAPSETLLVSSPDEGTLVADGSSYHTTMSADGRYVTFMSLAANLVRDDRNGEYDIFVRDVARGRTFVASRPSGSGAPTANGRSSWPAISADGRFVAFQSFASNLGRGDSNRAADVFARDLRSDVTRLVSLSRRGGGGANGASYDPAISADGRFVAFQSFASNLVRGDRNRRADVFVRDLRTGVTRLASVGGRGGADGSSDNPAISADGRFVAFESSATNLVRRDGNGASDVYVRDLRGRTVRRVSSSHRGGAGRGASYMPAISGSGRFVAFVSRADDIVAGDVNGSEDVFVRDLRTGRARMVSGRPGRRAVSLPPDRTIYPSISATGRYVAFHSDRTDLVAGDANRVGDVFRRDLVTGTVLAVSSPSGYAELTADGYSGGPSISGDGRFAAFASGATNLVAGDTNARADIFRRELEAPRRPGLAARQR